MNQNGIERLIDFTSYIAREARVTLSDGTKRNVPVRKIEKDKDKIRIFFYIPAAKTNETITRVELIDETGTTIDEQNDRIEKMRRQGFMTAFEYKFSEVK